jgi:glycosyltransferase involved in cell wall biosynthesis
MKVLIVCPYPVGCAPSQRFRFEQYFGSGCPSWITTVVSPAMTLSMYKHLARPGVYQVLCLLRGALVRLRDLWRATEFDVIVIHKEAYPVGPPVFEKALIYLNPRVIFDFDDSLHVMPEWRVKPGFRGWLLRWLEYPSRTAEIIERCALAAAGCPFLKTYAEQFNPRVVLVPTCIDTESFCPAVGSPSRRVRIGWSGSFSTVSHLRTIEPILREVASRYDVEFLVVGAPEFSMPGCHVIAREWNAAEELDNFGSMDIGVMPLPDNEATRGKCGLKALQYMAMGIPAICSAVGVNCDILQDGVNGFLAHSDGDWREKLALLIESRELREKLGRAGRETVLCKYSTEAVAPVFWRSLATVASGCALDYGDIVPSVRGKLGTLK